MSSIPGEAASEGMESQPNAQPSTDKSSGTMKDVQNAMFMFEEFQKVTEGITLIIYCVCPFES